MVEQISMLALELDAREVARLAQVHGMRGVADEGYALHAALRALFGELAPKPFSLDPSSAAQLGRVRVLAYTAASEVELLNAMDSATRDDLLPTFAAGDPWFRPLPTVFARGQRLRYEVRVCPVRRANRSGDVVLGGARRTRFGKGAEIDVYVVDRLRAEESGTPIESSREAVYADWLSAQLTRHGDAHLDSARLVRFQRRRFARRGAPDGNGRRKRRRIERPDATLAGQLTVGEPRRFHELLTRGVGRHRAFGFGMLLLRPAG